VPKIAPDEKVVKAVDALFTAIRYRDAGRLDECEQRLHGCEDTGILPPEASRYRDAIVQTARTGRWQSAGKRLYEFMRAQERLGRRSHTKRALGISTDSPGRSRSAVAAGR
jgi:hypothetical protein